MEDIELLAISLSLLFGVGMIFSVLLWCRSWRKDEREQTDLQIKAMEQSVRTLAEAIEMLDHTTASLQTADGLLTQQLEDLRSSVDRLQTVKLKEEPKVVVQTLSQAALQKTEQDVETSVIKTTTELESEKSYEAVAGFLKEGKSTLEIARELDIGVAEVRMIARMHAANHPNDPSFKELLERG